MDDLQILRVADKIIVGRNMRYTSQADAMLYGNTFIAGEGMIVVDPLKDDEQQPASPSPTP